jgi:hypothetical protein
VGELGKLLALLSRGVELPRKCDTGGSASECRLCQWHIEVEEKLVEYGWRSNERAETD